MADLGRKDFGDKTKEALTPQNQKTTLDKAKETITDTADKAAANLTPESQKSFGQTVGDSVQKGHDDAKKATKSHQQTLGETASEYLEAAKEQVNNATEYVSGVVTGATEGAKKGGSGTSA